MGLSSPKEKNIDQSVKVNRGEPELHLHLSTISISEKSVWTKFHQLEFWFLIYATGFLKVAGVAQAIAHCGDKCHLCRFAKLN